MSKRSRRRNRALAAIAGVMGAKALGLFGKTPVGSSGVVGKTPEFRKSFVKPKVKTPIAKPKNLMPDVSKTKKAFPLKTSDKKPIGGSPFKMFGVKEMPSKESISKFKAAEAERVARVKSKSASMKKLQEKFGNTDFGLGMYDMNKGGSVKMVKARGGGMARTKPTKMY